MGKAKKYKRIFTIVIDSLGIGAMADAAEYGDAGTDTLGHISESVDKFNTDAPYVISVIVGIIARTKKKASCPGRSNIWGI